MNVTLTIRCLRTTKTALAFIHVALMMLSPLATTSQTNHVVAIYRERGAPSATVTTPTMFGGSGTVMFDVQQRGVYVVDTVSWLARQISEVGNMGSYQYSVFVRRSRGGVACQQWGSAGNRLWKFDEDLRIWADTLPFRIDTFNIYIGTKPYTDHCINFVARPYQSELSMNMTCISFDGCDTWQLYGQRFLDSTIVARWILGDGIGGLWMSPMSMNHVQVVHPWALPPGSSEPVLTPVRRLNGSAGPSYYTQKAFLGRDTIVWIQDLGFSQYYLGIGALGDTTARHFSRTITTAPGRTVNIQGACHLFNTQTRRVFMRDSAMVLYEYRAGQWHVVDTARHILSASTEPAYRAECVTYPAKFEDGTTGYTVLHLADSLVQELRPHQYNADDYRIRYYPNVHANVAHTALNFSGPAALTLKSGRGFVLSSTLRDIEDLDPAPMIHGIGADAGQAPLIVSYYGHLVRPTETRAGELISTVTNGEVTGHDGNFKPVPKWYTTRGSLPPAVSSTDILFPGTELRQFSRKGKYLGIIDADPSTCALRLSEDDVLIGNSTTVRRWQQGVLRESVDVRSQLTETDSIGSGFFSTMVASGDTAVIGFVSGLHVYDNESLQVHRHRCGGIVRTTDKGASWQRIPVDGEDPYFLGTVTGSNGEMFACYTTTIRDTAKMRLEESRLRDHEPLFTTMQDCNIIRSADGGLTWQTVYSRSVSLGFRFVGVSGIRLRDGTLLINGIDGVLESRDNGINWDFHDIGFNEFTNVISLFTDDDGRDVYYCTTTGVFRSERTTWAEEKATTAEEAQRTIPVARTWSGHQQAWEQSGVRCIGLTSIIGGTTMIAVAPAPGFYSAHLRNSEGHTTTALIMVTAAQ